MVWHLRATGFARCFPYILNWLFAALDTDISKGCLRMYAFKKGHGSLWVPCALPCAHNTLFMSLQAHQMSFVSVFSLMAFWFVFACRTATESHQNWERNWSTQTMGNVRRKQVRNLETWHKEQTNILRRKKCSFSETKVILTFIHVQKGKFHYFWTWKLQIPVVYET